MKKTFDAPVGMLPDGRAAPISDIEFMEAQVRSCENEIRVLKEVLRDRFAMAALTGIVLGYSPDVSKDEGDYRVGLRGAAKIAFDLADEMLIVRKL